GEAEVSVQPVLVANHTGTLLRATLDGAGISTQPLDLIARHLRSGRLRHVLPEWTTGHFTLYATLPTRKFMPARVRSFLDFVAEHTQRSMQGLPANLPALSI
ncbi:MAG TPA: LysR family transcriptional regulator, partial [Delftia acidovorans]|nr:LysR family transcriptional regulator [Delftia acidovorans]